MKIINQNEKEWLDRGSYFKKILVTKDDLKTKDDVLVQIFKSEPHTEVKAHYHKIMKEIFYVLSGNAVFYIGDDKREHKAGDVLITEPEDIHGVINDSDGDFLMLVFKINPAENDIYWVEE